MGVLVSTLLKGVIGEAPLKWKSCNPGPPKENLSGMSAQPKLIASFELVVPQCFHRFYS
jgi:hypothetical protein